MKLLDSTYEILLWKHIGRSVDSKWSVWATDMLMAGFESEHLIELTILEKPYNQFQLSELVSKVFDELGLDYKDREKVLNNYISYLSKETLNERKGFDDALRELSNLCIELNYDSKLYDFYSLHYAREDLKHDNVQWYVNGADRTNIDQVCRERFEQWLLDFPLP